MTKTLKMILALAVIFPVLSGAAPWCLAGQGSMPNRAGAVQVLGDMAGEAGISLSVPEAGKAVAVFEPSAKSDPLTGPQVQPSRDWTGLRSLPKDAPILVLAGHADSQGIDGAGTPGAAVALRHAKPMDPTMTDELFWTLLTAREVESLGRQRGLNIKFYDPPARKILSGDDPRTNWSVGKAHVLKGGYALELHYDAYGPDGKGSGLIPPVQSASTLVGPPTSVDESLAQAFGRFPAKFRDGLGGPTRGLALLEIGKLEGALEAALRDPQRRADTIRTLAKRIVDALESGLRTR